MPLLQMAVVKIELNQSRYRFQIRCRSHYRFHCRLKEKHPSSA